MERRSRPPTVDVKVHVIRTSSSRHQLQIFDRGREGSGGRVRSVSTSCASGRRSRTQDAQAQKRLHPLVNLRLVARISILFQRLVKSQTFSGKMYNKIEPLLRSLYFPESERTENDTELLFDVSKFKISKRYVLSDDTRKVLLKPTASRTERDLANAQVALRDVKSFTELPIRMQRQILEVGLYQRFEAKRIVVMQGDPASAFYFILSGAAVVLISEGDWTITRPVATLRRGVSFGELAIVNGTFRTSTIIAKEMIELLCIGAEDFRRIFMLGGRRNTADPDQLQFLRNLRFLDGWPLEKITSEERRCIFHYFKSGEVLVRNSLYSDWIIIVKSGSLRVLKKLRRMRSIESDKRRCKPLKYFDRRRTLKDKPSSRNPPCLVSPATDTAGPVPGNTIHTLERKTNKPFRSRFLKTLSDIVSASSQIQLIEVAPGEAEGGGISGSLDRTSSIVCPEEPQSPDFDLSTMAHSSRWNGSTKVKGEELSPVRRTGDWNSSLVDYNLDLRGIGTIANDLDHRRNNACHENEEEDDLQFVQVQSLFKGQVFGVADLVLDDQPRLVVVSSGAECILLEKTFYLENAPNELLQRLRFRECCPFPSDNELQERLRKAIQWSNFKKKVLAMTTNKIRQSKMTANH